MTSRDPFQPKTFCDSVNTRQDGCFFTSESLENEKTFYSLKENITVMLYHNPNLGSMHFKVWEVIKNMTMDNKTSLLVLTIYI